MSAAESSTGQNAARQCPAGGTCPLNCLESGSCGKVVAVGGDTETRRRILEMGFCNGVAVELVRRAPLGDPIEFRLRGYCLSLRNEQAKNIVVSLNTSHNSSSD